MVVPRDPILWHKAPQEYIDDLFSVGSVKVL